MRKRVLAIVLTIAMCTMMSSTAFAASSSSSSSSSKHSSSSSAGGSSSASSSSTKTTTEATKGNVNTDSVSVATVTADGSVATVNLTQYTTQVNSVIADVAASSIANGMNPGEAVSAVMTSPASDIFKATINALGGNIKLVNAGGYKVASAMTDESGKTIASVGTVNGVSKYAFVMLTAVNADGSIEVVEGVVDPVSLQVIGVFTGTPSTITVSVIVPAN